MTMAKNKKENNNKEIPLTETEKYKKAVADMEEDANRRLLPKFQH